MKRRLETILAFAMPFALAGLPACGGDDAIAGDPAARPHATAAPFESIQRETAALALDDDDTFIEPHRKAVTSRFFPGVLDSDGDGVLNFVEQYGCTDPYNPDSDGDGIPDGWEMYGNDVFDYPGAGASPCHKDVFVEVDYEERTVGGVIQSARMGDTLQAQLVAYYAALPLANPDGTNGINLHLYMSDVMPANTACSTYNSAFSYDPDAFHKLELCLADSGGAKGKGSIPGQLFHVTAQLVNQDPTDDLTEPAVYRWYWFFLHELGHNLGLRHGGNVNTNRIPHYPSVMNYLYDDSLNGSAQTLAGAGVGYTTSGEFAQVLDECNLRERNPFAGASLADVAFMTYPPASFATRMGVLTGPWVDWDRDGTFETGTVRADVNGDGAITCGSAFADVNDIDILATEMGKGLPSNPIP
jgi:hypothetical protein